MHIPPYTQNLNEPDAWNNLPNHERNLLYNLFKKYDVKFVFTGHCHNNFGVDQKLVLPAKKCQPQILSLGACSVNLNYSKDQEGKFVFAKNSEQDPLGWHEIEYDMVDGNLVLTKTMHAI